MSILKEKITTNIVSNVMNVINQLKTNIIQKTVNLNVKIATSKS